MVCSYLSNTNMTSIVLIHRGHPNYYIIEVPIPVQPLPTLPLLLLQLSSTQNSPQGLLCVRWIPPSLPAIPIEQSNPCREDVRMPQQCIVRIASLPILFIHSHSNIVGNESVELLDKRESNSRMV